MHMKILLNLKLPLVARQLKGLGAVRSPQATPNGHLSATRHIPRLAVQTP